MDLENFYIEIGKNIKRCRKAAGLTQEQLAEKADISLDFMSKIEVNISKPGLKTIFKLAAALDISPAEFFK